ncbi:MAG: hypothetical protein G01um101472_612, partial [Parcubacteria group bacterium Gr01-1014_72]
FAHLRRLDAVRLLGRETHIGDVVDFHESD